MKLITPGTQEYVAIALKEALDFDCLKLTPEKLVPNWTSDRSRCALAVVGQSPQ